MASYKFLATPLDYILKYVLRALFIGVLVIAPLLFIIERIPAVQEKLHSTAEEALQKGIPHIKELKLGHIGLLFPHVCIKSLRLADDSWEIVLNDIALSVSWIGWLFSKSAPCRLTVKHGSIQSPVHNKTIDAYAAFKEWLLTPSPFPITIDHMSIHNLSLTLYDATYHLNTQLSLIADAATKGTIVSFGATALKLQNAQATIINNGSYQGTLFVGADYSGTLTGDCLLPSYSSQELSFSASLNNELTLQASMGNSGLFIRSDKDGGYHYDLHCCCSDITAPAHLSGSLHITGLVDNKFTHTQMTAERSDLTIAGYSIQNGISNIAVDRSSALTTITATDSWYDALELTGHIDSEQERMQATALLIKPISITPHVTIDQQSRLILNANLLPMQGKLLIDGLINNEPCNGAITYDAGHLLGTIFYKEHRLNLTGDEEQLRLQGTHGKQNDLTLSLTSPYGAHVLTIDTYWHTIATMHTFLFGTSVPLNGDGALALCLEQDANKDWLMTASVRDASLMHSQIIAPLISAQLSGLLQLGQSKLMLNTATLHFEQGKIIAHGDAQLQNGNYIGQAILQIDHLVVGYQQHGAQFSAQLTVNKQEDRALLTGTIIAEQLDLDPTSLLLPSAIEGTDDDTVDLRLEVIAAKPIPIQLPFLTGNFAPHLHLTGTNVRPSISGSITIEDAMITIAEHKLTVQAEAILSPGQQLNIDVHARTTIDQYRITAHIFGPINNPTIQLRSIPDLAEHQIASLLITESDQSLLNAITPTFLLQQVKQKIMHSIFGEEHRLSNLLSRIKYRPELSEDTKKSKNKLQVVLTDHLRASVEKGMALDDPAQIKIDYLLDDDLLIRAVKEKNGEIATEVELNFKF